MSEISRDKLLEVLSLIGRECTWIESTGIVEEHAHLGDRNGWMTSRVNLNRAWELLNAEVNPPEQMFAHLAEEAQDSTPGLGF